MIAHAMENRSVDFLDLLYGLLDIELSLIPIYIPAVVSQAQSVHLITLSFEPVYRLINVRGNLRKLLQVIVAVGQMEIGHGHNGMFLVIDFCQSKIGRASCRERV